MDFTLLYAFNIFKFNTICALFCLFVKLECLPLLHSLKVRKASPCCPGPACPLQRLPTQEWEWGGLRGQGGKRTKQRTDYYEMVRDDPPKKWNLFIKSCVFLCVYTSDPFKVLSIWCRTPIKMFFPLCKTVFEYRFWWLSGLLLFFVSPLPPQQNISLWGLFSSGETKKKDARVRLGE